jgi:hypothetical protein
MRLVSDVRELLTEQMRCRGLLSDTTRSNPRSVAVLVRRTT